MMAAMTIRARHRVPVAAAIPATRQQTLAEWTVADVPLS
jgi:hypothetical protein